MSGLDLSRRSFLRGMSAAVAAPAVIRVAALMPVRVFLERPAHVILTRTSLPIGAWRHFYADVHMKSSRTCIISPDKGGLDITTVARFMGAYDSDHHWPNPADWAEATQPEGSE